MIPLETILGECYGYDDDGGYPTFFVKNMMMIPVPIPDDDDLVAMSCGHLTICCIMYMYCYGQVSDI